jgi:NhaP-type Na+/H+ or K+/H+ antiporter
METTAFVAVLLCILAAAAISRRVQGTILTLPMLYAAFGLILGSWGLGLIQADIESEWVRIIAEVTLVLVLASDASRIDLGGLVRDHSLPQRLLGIGLPLTMVCGTLVAAVMFGVLSFWEAAILAVILTPTDASLGQSVVTNPRVPVRIRQTLNIESGLNDGIAMPFLLLAISLAVATGPAPGEMAAWLLSVIIQISLSIAIGVVVGYVGVKFIERGERLGWMSEAFQKISAVAFILLAYGMAELVGGNGFIAAFCMGATAGHLARKEQREILQEHVEVEVELLMLLTFLIFGAVMLPPALDGFNGMVALYAILSLTLIRMLPVAIGMIGAKVRPITTLFLGWFGPRGVASILYIFTVLDAEGIPGVDLIYAVVMVTVLFSIIAHGVTAAPGAKWYGQRMTDIIEEETPDVREMEEVPEMPLRSKADLQ